jgi:hypothetical protein
MRNFRAMRGKFRALNVRDGRPGARVTGRRFHSSPGRTPVSKSEHEEEEHAQDCAIEEQAQDAEELFAMRLADQAGERQTDTYQTQRQRQQRGEAQSVCSRRHSTFP